VIGVFLVILGVFCFVATNSEHYTALIPAAFGVVFMVLGLLAAKESLRKHAMHVAAALATLAFLFGVYRIVTALAVGKELGTAFVETAVFASFCGLLAALCVKSFVDARRRRSQQART
jgi:membrane associated rhomboid family serine protease